MTNIWNTETCYEIANRKPRFAIIPIGSFEQHGKHLPVTTDTLIAGLIGKAICDAYGGFLVSPITVTCSHEHAGFPSSLSISAETLIHVLRDLIASIESNGIPLTVLVNGHGGNYVIVNVAQELNVSRPRVFISPTRQHWQAAMSFAGVEKTVSEDMHGGEVETSILMYAMPEVVRHDEIEDWEATERPLLTLFGMRHYTKSGIIGFPSKATPEKGRLLVGKMAEVIGRDIEAILASQK
ncbi:MAG: creatininase family protein [Dokdonella sp.]|uniref:creatininase family protein n=1 Tax=Dokdonella sp. TaxID=2291710 RepID=UPI0025C64443|nr:creatininase family protein [Dokdonella sp.]MBZ0224046.1 creatininase family protein [Dokdonella sp.]